MPTPEPHRAPNATEPNHEAVSIVPDGTQERWHCGATSNSPADPEPAFVDDDDRTPVVGASEPSGGEELADDEQRILQYLGAALIMQWNTLPRKLQRELFDNAASMDELLDASALRGQLARFLHNHKDDDDQPIQTAWTVR